MSAADPSSTPRWIGFASGLLGALAILVGAASQFHPDVDGSDLWWHLASGRYISQLNEIPLNDPFSHTANGHPWTNHSWLWGWTFWDRLRKPRGLRRLARLRAPAGNIRTGRVERPVQAGGERGRAIGGRAAVD